ncbi:hypothetical protein ACIGW4_20075 [Streptomyces sp. NPDC053513]|uniref:hypothetical protein n=1 Tax=unclassified Streptomyces TaxID=2593676 RepID=UPI0037D256CA
MTDLVANRKGAGKRRAATGAAAAVLSVAAFGAFAPNGAASAGMPPRGPHGDGTSLRGLLDRVKGPKILVDHSYGGSVVTEVAASHAVAVSRPGVVTRVIGNAARPPLGEQNVIHIHERRSGDRS